MDSLVILWLLIGMAFLLIEIYHPHWVVFWFAVGAALAAAFSQILSLNGQILLFLASSLSLLYIGRPFVTKAILPRKTINNVEAFIGRIEEVVEDIDNTVKTGALKIHGTYWNAKSLNGNLSIKTGEKIKIISFDGLTAIVEPVKGEKS